MHVQFWWAVLPGADVEKAGHCWHAPSPDPVLNWLASQLMHGPPPGPEKPELQVQATAATLAAGE